MTIHENEGRERQIENWLVINWDSGSTRTRKSEPEAGDLGPQEIGTRLQLNVTIPEIDVPTLEADIEVPAPKVEATELEDVDADDVPSWKDVAMDVVEKNADAELNDEDINRLTITVLDETSERPPVATVREYVGDLLAQRSGVEA